LSHPTELSRCSLAKAFSTAMVAFGKMMFFAMINEFRVQRYNYFPNYARIIAFFLPVHYYVQVLDEKLTDCSNFFHQKRAQHHCRALPYWSDSKFLSCLDQIKLFVSSLCDKGNRKVNKKIDFFLRISDYFFQSLSQLLIIPRVSWYHLPTERCPYYASSIADSQDKPW